MKRSIMDAVIADPQPAWAECERSSAYHRVPIDVMIYNLPAVAFMVEHGRGDMRLPRWCRA